MSQEKNKPKTNSKSEDSAEEKKNSKRSSKKGGGKKAKRVRAAKRRVAQDEFEQRIIDIARVTRVMAGGKRMRFRACVAVGNKKGKVGFGVGKGVDVATAVTKAVAKAKKQIITVPMVNDTIPHEVYHSFGAAKLLIKPARKGRGVIAGGAVRIVFELAGIKNITSKILGSNNKMNNVICAMQALSLLKEVRQEDKKKDEKSEREEKKEENKNKKDKNKAKK